jgi:hypothetical protein
MKHIPSIAALCLSACYLDPTGPDPVVDPPDAGPVCLTPDPLPSGAIRYTVDSSGFQVVNGNDPGRRDIHVLRRFTPVPETPGAYGVKDSGTLTTTPGKFDTTRSTVPFDSERRDSVREFPIAGFADLIRYADEAGADPLLRVSGCLERHAANRTAEGPTSGAQTKYAYRVEGDSLVLTREYAMGPVTGSSKRIVLGLKDGLRSHGWTSGGRYGQGSFRMAKANPFVAPALFCFDEPEPDSLPTLRFSVDSSGGGYERNDFDGIRIYAPDPAGGEYAYTVRDSGTRTYDKVGNYEGTLQNKTFTEGYQSSRNEILAPQPVSGLQSIRESFSLGMRQPPLFLSGCFAAVDTQFVTEYMGGIRSESFLIDGGSIIIIISESRYKWSAGSQFVYDRKSGLSLIKQWAQGFMMRTASLEMHRE